MAESYHTRRVFTPDEFSFAMEMLSTYPWISRPLHRRGFDEMMDRLIQTEDERELLRMLLSKFVYVDTVQCEDLIQQIVGHLGVWGCDKKNTVFVATREKPRDNDGSVVFLKQLQDRLYEWTENNFENHFDSRHKFRRVKNYKKVIIVDDFIGSGMTICDRYSTLKLELDKTKMPHEIYIVALAGMNAAKNEYPILAQDITFVPLWLEKSFEKGVDIHETTVMSGILDRLNNRNNNSHHYELAKFGFGFGDMAGVYYNTHYRMSDNMLAIFWWGRFKDGKDVYHSMFRRA